MNEQQARPQTAATAQAGQGQTSPLDLALALVQHARLLVLLPLAIGLVALGISYLVPPTFTARTVILPPQQQTGAAAAALQSLGALAGIAGGAAGIKTTGDQYVSLMRSLTVKDRLIDQFRLMAAYEVAFRTDARLKLDRLSRLTLGKKDGLITIEVDDVDPARAAQIANAYVDQLRRITSELAVTEAQQRRLFFEQQMARSGEKLAGALRALQSVGINEGALRAEPRAAAENYAKLRAEATATEIRIQTMRGFLAESAPELRMTVAQLQALRDQLARAEANNSSAAGGEYLTRYREFKYQENLNDFFAKQYEIAKLDESREGAIVQVVDVAAPPERKSGPRKATIAITATLVSFIALLLGVLLTRLFRSESLSESTVSKWRAIRAALAQQLGFR